MDEAIVIGLTRLAACAGWVVMWGYVVAIMDRWWTKSLTVLVAVALMMPIIPLTTEDLGDAIAKELNLLLVAIMALGIFLVAIFANLNERLKQSDARLKELDERVSRLLFGNRDAELGDVEIVDQD